MRLASASSTLDHYAHVLRGVDERLPAQFNERIQQALNVGQNGGSAGARRKNGPTRGP